MCWLTACSSGFGDRGCYCWPGSRVPPLLLPCSRREAWLLLFLTQFPATNLHSHERPGRHAVLACKKRLVPEICVKGWNVTCLWLKIHVASIISRVGKFYFVTSITQKTPCFSLLIYWRFTPACKMLTLWGTYIDAYRQLKPRIHSFLTRVLKKTPSIYSQLMKKQCTEYPRTLWLCRWQFRDLITSDPFVGVPLVGWYIPVVHFQYLAKLGSLA